MFFSKLNYFLFPIAIILYIVGELTTAIFFRFLAKYDEVQNGTNPYMENTHIFWVVLAILLGIYFFLIIFNYFCLNVAVLLSNENIHKNMI